MSAGDQLCVELGPVLKKEATLLDMSEHSMPSENNDVQPYLDSLTEDTDCAIGETLSSVNTRGSLLDDALSAAMEAIADANRFHSSGTDQESGSDPAVPSDPLPIVSLNTSFDSLEKLDVEITADTDPTASDCHETAYFDSGTVYLEDLKATDFSDDNNRDAAASTGSAEDSMTRVPHSPSTIVSTPSSHFNLLTLHTHWRPIIRPIFERILIERLWTRGELGAGSPQSLLLSMWFFISRHFGVGCRTEHARLMLGHFHVRMDPSTGKQFLVFTRFGNRGVNPMSKSSSIHPKYADHLLPARPDCPDRCPVHLFQVFCTRRPASATEANFPFYLQPERNVLTLRSDGDAKSISAWFTANALGKNRIGSMLNVALQNLGLPVRRQVSLIRFCDTLAAAALSPAGAQTGSRLARLLANSRMNATALERELTACAENIVTLACTSGSPLHSLLAKSCEETRLTGLSNKSMESCATRTASNTAPHNRTRFVPIRPASSEHDVLYDTASMVTNAVVCSSSLSNNLTTACVPVSESEPIAGMPLPSPIQTHTSSLSGASALEQATVKSCENFHISQKNIVDLAKFKLTPDRTETHALELNPIGSFSLDTQSQLVSVNQLIPITILSTNRTSTSSNTPISSSDSVAVSNNSASSVLVESDAGNSNVPGTITTDVIPTRHDDIQVDCRKSGSGYGRSVPLELRELLDVVLTVAQVMPSPSSSSVRVKYDLNWSGYSGGGMSRPPVGLVTQLLWRARALDDRGPWILTFAMWWLMQHYFGVGSRSHHVRLRWGHLRLVSGVRDPVTDVLGEAIEYVGPSEYTTVKAFALLESTRDGQVIRRVYPSSGWAEAEISVASALAAESIVQRPRFRPLDTGPDVPGLNPRDGPDFVALFKAFTSRRQGPSLRSDSPFYVQPLQSAQAPPPNSAVTPWFSLDALGKNRIGALMRNIVDKVVRPNLPRIANAATMAAQASCVEVVRRVVLALPPSANGSQADLIGRRQVMLDKLSCVLGLTASAVTESGWLEQLNTCTGSPSEQPFTTANQISNPSAPSSGADSNHSVQLTQHPASSSLLQLATRQPGGILFHPSNLIASSHSLPNSSQVVLMAAKRATGTGNVTSLSDQPASGGLILIPTGGAGTNTTQSHPTHPSVFAHYPTQSTGLLQTAPIIVTASDGSFLNSTSLSKHASPSSTRQSIAYLTTPHHASSNGPVNLVFISPNSGPTVGTRLRSGTTDGQAINGCLIQCSSHSSFTSTSPISAATSAFGSTRPVPLVASGDLFARVVPRDLQASSNPCCSTGYTHIDPGNLRSGPQSVVATDTQTGQLMLYDDSTKIEFFTEKPIKVEEDQSLVTRTTCDIYRQSEGTGCQPVFYTSLSEPSKQIISQSHVLNPSFVSCAPSSTASDTSAIPASRTGSVNNNRYTMTDASNAILCASRVVDSAGTLNSHSRYLPSAPVLATSTDTCMRYIIPPPSASLLPAKLTPLPQSVPVRNTAQAMCTSVEKPVSDAIPCDAFRSLLDNSDPCAADSAERPMPVSVSTGRARSSIASSPGPVLPLSQMTCHATPPEPGPKQLLTLQAVIDEAWAFHCRDFPSYVEHLFRTGLLSATRPWCLNFSAWFINSVAFEVENRSEHGNLRWGDFRLCQTADGRTEYLYFINRVTRRAYYLAASPPSPYNLGYELPEAQPNELPRATETMAVRCPCPVAVFKALRDHRPTTCLDPYSKFYLQPRFQHPADEGKKAQQPVWTNSSTLDREWFTERAWGKNKLGSLFAEATKLAGLPMIWLRKHRSRSPWPNSIPRPNNDQASPTSSSSSHTERAENDQGLADGGVLVDNHDHNHTGLDSDIDNNRHSCAKRRKLSPAFPQDRNSDIFPVHTGDPIQLPSSSTILSRKSTSFASTNA